MSRTGVKHRNAQNTPQLQRGALSPSYSRSISRDVISRDQSDADNCRRQLKKKKSAPTDSKQNPGWGSRSCTPSVGGDDCAVDSLAEVPSPGPIITKKRTPTWQAGLNSGGASSSTGPPRAQTPGGLGSSGGKFLRATNTKMEVPRAPLPLESIRTEPSAMNTRVEVHRPPPLESLRPDSKVSYSARTTSATATDKRAVVRPLPLESVRSDSGVASRPQSGHSSARSNKAKFKTTGHLKAAVQVSSTASHIGRLIAATEQVGDRHSMTTQQKDTDRPKSASHPAKSASHPVSLTLPPTEKPDRPHSPDRKGRKLSRADRGSPKGNMLPEDFSHRLFKYADRDCDGVVRFEEFITQHSMLVNLALGQAPDSIALKKSSKHELERQFRDIDTDRSMALDFEEYKKYMDGIRDMLAPPLFARVCAELLEAMEQLSRHEKDSCFDTAATDVLLAKTRAAPVMIGEDGAFVEPLLARRADPNFTDMNGDSALLLAAEKASASIMRIMVQAANGQGLRQQDGDCPLLRALRKRNMEVLRLFLVPPDDSICSIVSTELKECEEVSMELVRKMPEASEKDVRELLAKKADLNFRDKNGWTALIAAVFWGKRDCVEAILHVPHSARQRVNITNNNGHSALHIAARKGREDIVLALLAGRCNPDVQDLEGWTPLHHACYNGMDEAVQTLVDASANVTIRGHMGFTPWMAAAFPSHAKALKHESLKLLGPNVSITFSQINRVLSSSKEPYKKVEELFNLPGVYGNFSHLRLHERFFSPTGGPNRAWLMAMWDGLAKDLLIGLRNAPYTDRSAEAPHYSSSCSATDSDYEEEEDVRQWKEQFRLLEHWFQETRGPAPSPNWTYDCREPYRDELDTVIANEVKGFRAEFEELYARLQDDDDGMELCSKPACTELRDDLLSQLGAHPILTWLDSLDAPGAFQALRDIGALGSTSNQEAIEGFIDLICAKPDFHCPKSFWCNVYKLWLHHYACTAEQEFQSGIWSIVNAFNDRYNRDGLRATCQPAAVLSYEQMKAKEDEHGKVAVHPNSGRWVAGCILDVVRTTVTVNCARAATLLLDEFFKPASILENRLELVRVLNGFNNEHSATSSGYRSLVLNVHFDGGIRLLDQAAASQKRGAVGIPGASVNEAFNTKDMHLALIGEVQVVLGDFFTIHKRMHLITRYLSGEFDHPRRSPPSSPRTPRQQRGGRLLRNSGSASDDDVWGI